MKKIIVVKLLFLVLSVFGQSSIMDRTFETGFNAQERYLTIPEPLKIQNDSTITFIHRSKQSGLTIQYLERYFINTADLSTRYIDTVYNYLTGPPLYVDTLQQFNLFPVISTNKDSKYNESYFYESYMSSVDTTIRITVSTIDGLKKKDSTLFIKSFKGKFVTDEPFIYDSTVYIRSSSFNNDTVYIDAIHLNGNYLGGGAYFDQLVFPNFQTSVGPLGISPNNDSLLLIGSFSFLDLFSLNRFTFEIDKANVLSSSTGTSLTNQFQWVGFINNKYTFYNNYYQVSGELVQTPFMQNFDFTIDRGGFSIDFDYDGNILSTKEFGSDSINENFAHRFKTDGALYYSGSSSYDGIFNYIQDYRNLMVFKVTTNSRDSVLYYGNSNHLNYGIVVDSNEDIFTISQYSNAWSDDSIFTVLTKIPNSLLVSVKEYNPKVSSILVYPNPTRDQLRVDGAETGEFYKIVSITGQLVLEGRLSDSKTINVGSLKTGSYFLQLESQRAATYRANVFMKE